MALETKPRLTLAADDSSLAVQLFEGLESIALIILDDFCANIVFSLSEAVFTRVFICSLLVNKFTIFTYVHFY